MKGFNAPFNHRPNPLGTSRRHFFSSGKNIPKSGNFFNLIINENINSALIVLSKANKRDVMAVYHNSSE